MKIKLEFAIRVLSSFIEDDGYAHFTQINLYNACKYDTFKRIQNDLIDLKLIEDCTINGYAKRIKIMNPLECPDFLFCKDYGIIMKTYLLEQ